MLDILNNKIQYTLSYKQRQMFEVPIKRHSIKIGLEHLELTSQDHSLYQERESINSYITNVMQYLRDLRLEVIIIVLAFVLVIYPLCVPSEPRVCFHWYTGLRSGKIISFPQRDFKLASNPREPNIIM